MVQIQFGKYRWIPYLGLILLTNVTIWGVTLLYLKQAKPKYTSEWAISLPGSAPGIDVNLPDIGQASSSSNSPFGGATTDPRANYQFIVMSEAVLKKSANAVHQTVEEFGKPRVKLVDNTTIMTVQVQGNSPEHAQQKAEALYQSLSLRLNMLRIEEITRREEGVSKTLKTAKDKLITAQARLSRYKVESGLSFPGQVDNLSVNVEQLRRQRSELLVQTQQSTGKLEQLANSLGISPQQASSAFLLQADQTFQQDLKTYSESTATLSILRSKWGNKHPEVVRELAKQAASSEALRDRSLTLLGQELDPQAMAILSLSPSDQGGGRTGLFRDLIAAQAEQQGLLEATLILERQINGLDSRLSRLSQQQSELENLEREMKTAEAIFASTVAKLDLGKSEIFSAYPLTQLLVEPALPEKPTAPRKSIIFLGAAIASLFCTTAIGLLWWRQRSRLGGRNSPISVPVLSDVVSEGETTLTPAPQLGEEEAA